MFLVLSYLGLQSKIAGKQIMSCIKEFYGCIDLRVIFQSTRRIKSLFPYKDRLSRGQMARLYIELRVGTAMIFITEKLKDDCMTEKVNILKH